MSRSLRWMSSTYAFIPSAANDFANRSLMYALECNPSSCGDNPDVAPHRVDSETSGVPVERRTQVVGEPVAWVSCVNTLSKLLGLGVDGPFRLHPQEVSIRGECDRPVDRTKGTALVAVVSFPGPGGVPVPVRRSCETELSLGDIEGIRVGEVGIRLRNCDRIHSSSTTWRASPVLPALSASNITVTSGRRAGFVEPRMNAWSRSSTLVVIRVAASESVRAMTRFSTPMMSY